MFTAINNNKYKNICTLDMIHVKKQRNTDYWNVIHGHKGFLAA